MISAKWLVSLVFLDIMKDDKPFALSHNSSRFITVRDEEEPTYYSQRVGHGVLGRCCGLSFAVYPGVSHGCEGKCFSWRYVLHQATLKS